MSKAKVMGKFLNFLGEKSWENFFIIGARVEWVNFVFFEGIFVIFLYFLMEFSI
jgi:hypothetical protein